MSLLGEAHKLAAHFGQAGLKTHGCRDQHDVKTLGQGVVLKPEGLTEETPQAIALIGPAPDAFPDGEAQAAVA